MRKIILIAFVFALGFASCHSDKSSSTTFDPAKQVAKDDSIIQAYAKANHIIATKHSSGLYYQIVKEGTGTNATENSTVQVNYEGKLPDGNVFDKSTSPVSFPLKNVVPGWTIGIPLVKAGGKIILLIPSALGYGTQSAGPIPENSVLIFNIDVLNVQ